MKIRIIQGVYGFVNKAGSIEPKSSKDGIFEINDAEGNPLPSPVLQNTADDVTFCFNLYEKDIKKLSEVFASLERS